MSDAWPTGIPRPGETIGERYVVERMLGQGGMGVVLAARHADLGQQVAIKLLLPGAASSPEAAARFLREARACVRIQSDHVARVFDQGRLPSGAPYMVMEHLSGTDLSALVATKGQLSIADAVSYVLQALEGLAAAHGLGIVHRDMKPSNLFLESRPGRDDIVKVLDFGISKAAIVDEPGRESLTATSAAMGTPLYMSPEQIRGAKAVDRRTDLWSIGVVLYELLAGRVPFEAPTAPALCVVIATEEPRPINVWRPDIPPGLEAVVARCLQKPVEARYSDAGELASALAPFAPDQSARVARIVRLSRSAIGLDATVQTSAPIAPSPAASTQNDLARTMRKSVSGRTGAVLGGSAAVTLIGVVFLSLYPAQRGSSGAPVVAVRDDASVASSPIASSAPASPGTTPTPRPDVPLASVAVAAPTGQGFLSVSCDPACDDIDLDGKSLGAGPLAKVPVDAGAHVVTARKAGQPPRISKISVGVGDVQPLRVTFGRAAGPPRTGGARPDPLAAP